MLHERLESITQLIESKGMVKSTDLILRFGVSIETIRRDLEFLEEQGKLKRVYGGAISNESKGIEREYNKRENLHIKEKMAIAKKTAELINDGEAIIFDLGTTTLEVAKCLTDKKHLTILTNSLPVAMEAIKNKTFHVYILGGELRNGDFSTSGFIAGNTLENFRADKAIIGASGVSEENGITDYHAEEAAVRRKMIEACKYPILCADSSKFGLTAFVRVCPLSSIHTVVTDWDISAQAKEMFKNTDTQLEIADSPIPKLLENE